MSTITNTNALMNVNAPIVQSNQVNPVHGSEMSSMMKVMDTANLDVVLAQPKAAKQATRPVNSFMIFRTYLSTIFGKAHQKEISGVLTYLWKNELAQNKWAILAKAYSIIRDAQGKNLSPIEIFLQINAPFISIPPAGQYLRVTGWTIRDNGDCCIVRRDDIDRALLGTSRSVHDVVQHSIEAGFVVIKNLSQLQFDLMMVKANAEVINRDKPSSPESLRYIPSGPGLYDDFSAANPRTDYTPYLGDTYDTYNMSVQL